MGSSSLAACATGCLADSQPSPCRQPQSIAWLHVGKRETAGRCIDEFALFWCDLARPLRRHMPSTKHIWFSLHRCSGGFDRLHCRARVEEIVIGIVGMTTTSV
uniref:Uncharacterized protein n=1 Tax=Setaria viridis TaxID=4556 RepID=A0A4U6UZ23_SETVI|nr:hypothetical protein SEVIR_4G064200v2 [Setaria viridis]